jgi:hypothetical protein
MPSLNPKGFQDIPLCELCFEDALKAGAKRSEELDTKDFHETSVRFCIDGLYKWMKSYSRNCGGASVFIMSRDISWWWASFCSTDDTLSKIVKEYYVLLKDITENTDYTDLAERMDEQFHVEKIGRGGRPFNIFIPRECFGVISDCATAVGAPFSIFFQLGLAQALSTNRNGLFSKWATSKVVPLFSEVMGKAKSRMRDFRRIRNDMEFQDAEEIEQ